MAFGMFRSKPPSFHPDPQLHPQAHLPHPQHANYFTQQNPWAIPQTPQAHFAPFEPWPSGAPGTAQRGLFGQRNGFGNGHGNGNGEFEFKAIENVGSSPSKNRGRSKGRSPSKGERRYLE